MAVNASDITEYTDAEILKCLRSALVHASVAQSYSYGGRQLNRMSAKEIHALIEVYEARVQNASDENGGIVLARFGSAQ